jgi:glycosyltransferase involved in cell wall biosynthesis
MPAVRKRRAGTERERAMPTPDTRPAPLVSIVICNYNYGRFVRCAIESALAQTYPDTEVIVVDDGSTDSSRSVIEEFSSTGRVEAIYQGNEGQYSAYNAGFAASSGDVVLFLDADDVYLPDTVRRVVEAMDADTAKVHFRLSFIGPSGEPRDGHTPRQLATGAVGELLATKGLLYSSAPGSGNAFARRALTELFPLPVTEDMHGADFYTIYGAALQGPVVALDAVLGHYRLHGSRDEEKASLVFGNAAKVGNESERLRSRIRTFKVHVKQRLGIDLPKHLVSFSTQKQEFVVQALGETRYMRRLAAGHAHAASLWYALKTSPDIPIFFKSCILVWAVLVVVLPRGLALPLARYVSNAAAR